MNTHQYQCMWGGTNTRARVRAHTRNLIQHTEWTDYHYSTRGLVTHTYTPVGGEVEDDDSDEDSPAESADGGYGHVSCSYL